MIPGEALEEPMKFRNKPREFWIELGGDPSNDKEVYKRYCATAPFKPSSYSEEVVCTVEVKEGYKVLSQDQITTELHKIWLECMGNEGKPPSYGYLKEVLPKRLGFE